jgi:subtilisin-like proprotein convertase family protein
LRKAKCKEAKYVNCISLNNIDIVLRFIFSWLGCIFLLSTAGAQCEFAGVLPIADEGVTGLNLVVNNAINNNLTDPNQGVCEVWIKFKHDVVGDLNITLISPSNQQVQLIGAGGAASGFTDGTVWDIKFTSCLSPSSPDPGYSPIWDNTEAWQAFQSYDGTYYPYSGCLEDFDIGTVNGTWTLLVEDVAQLDEGVIEYFSILFCDNQGIDCAPCNPPLAMLLQDTLQICQGVNWSPQELHRQWLGTAVDTFNYKSAFLYFKDKAFIATSKDTAANSLSPGQYQLCLLNFHKSDSLLVDSLPLGFTDTMAAEILLEKGICGLISDCIQLNILPVSDTVIVNQILCAGDTLVYGGKQFTDGGTYYLNLKEGSCDSIVALTVEIRKVIPEVLFSNPILNCNHVFLDLTLSGLDTSALYSIQWSTLLGNITAGADSSVVRVNASGNYYFSIQSDGCNYTDTIIVVSDTSIPQLQLEADVLSCNLTTATIELSSNIPLLDVMWYGPGPILKMGDNALVTVPGVYRAEVLDQNGCATSKSVEVKEDVAKPFLTFAVHNIDCNKEFGTIQVLDSFNIENVLWSGPGPETPTALNSHLLLPGNYSLHLTGFNGCDTILEITIADVRYQVDVILRPDTLTCNKQQATLIPLSSRVISKQLWTYPDMTVTEIIDPTVMQGGLYKVVITDINGCTGEASMVLLIDTLAPQPLVSDKLIDCDSSSVLLFVTNASPNFLYTWGGPAGFNSMAASERVIVPGIYHVTVTDAKGCSGSTTFEVFMSQDLPDIDFMIDTFTCQSDTAQLVPTDTMGLDFLWLTSDMLNAPKDAIGIVDHPGSYNVRITDRSNGCKRDYYLGVVDGRQYATYILAADTLGCINNASTLKVTGNIKVKTFLWSGTGFSSTLPVPMVNEAGWYYLQMTDSMDCVYLDSVEVKKAADVPVVNITGENITCASNQAMLTATVNAGVSINWRKDELPLGNGPLITVFSPGIYTAVGLGQGGCKDSASYEVIYDTLPPQLQIMPLITLDCTMDSVQLTVATNKPLQSVYWSGPNQFASTKLQPHVAMGGDYRLMVTDSVGCTAEVSTKVEIDSSRLTFDTLVSNITCAKPGAIEILFSEPGVAITWIQSPIPLADGLTQFESLAAGQYEFAAVSSKGCKASALIEIQLDTIHPASNGLSGGSINCKNANVIIGFLNGLPTGVSVIWNQSGETTDSIEVVTAGKYTGKLTGKNGCSTDFEIMVNEDFKPPVFSTKSDTIDCIKSKTDLQVLGNEGYDNVIWMGPDGTVFAGQSVKVDKPGLYKVLVTGENGCTSTDSARVESNFDLPQIMVSDSFYLPCDGTGIQLSFLSPDSIVAVKWVGINKPFFSTSREALIFEVNKFKVSAVAVNGCEASDTVFVVPSLLRPLFSLKSDSIGCMPAFATLKAENIKDDAGFIWKNSNGEIFATDSILVDNPGFYTLVVTALNGCKDSLSAFVAFDTIKPEIVLEAIGEIHCQKRMVTLLANVDISIDEPNFLWSTPNGNFVSGLTTLSPLIDQPGDYLLSVTNPQNGCHDSLTISIEEKANTLSASYDIVQPVCFGANTGSINLSGISNGVPPFIFTINEVQSPDTSVSNLGSGTYFMQVKDGDGCIAYDTIPLVSRTETFIILPSDTTITLGEKLELGYESVPFDASWASVQWLHLSDGTLLCDNCYPLIIQPDDKITIGIYAVDSFGCAVADTIIIDVSSAVNLSIPNSLLLSDGSENGSFFIEAYPFIREIEFLEIYDNWGNLIFKRNHFPAGDPVLGWDGKFRGQEVNPGVYVYRLGMLLKSGERIVKNKDITVVK